MKKLALALIPLALLAGCGSSDSEPEASAEPEIRAASPAKLTAAYGKIVGTCMGVKYLDASLDYEERENLRGLLQSITDTVEVAPDTKSTDGQTAEEILFDVIPYLKKCDQGLFLEAQTARDKLAAS